MTMLHAVELREQSNIQLPGKWSGTGCPVLRRWIASYYHAGGPQLYSALITHIVLISFITYLLKFFQPMFLLALVPHRMKQFPKD